ncbi:Uncharacterized protein Fot_23857 [Forsythia ovata]|uniref:Uncharacterized protein n=1 Tax=Forsythia ovata TaxID=205694 RepID=A0ABD1U4K8_9LAMI
MNSLSSHVIFILLAFDSAESNALRGKKEFVIVIKREVWKYTKDENDLVIDALDQHRADLDPIWNAPAQQLPPQFLRMALGCVTMDMDFLVEARSEEELPEKLNRNNSITSINSNESPTLFLVVWANALEKSLDEKIHLISLSLDSQGPSKV